MENNKEKSTLMHDAVILFVITLIAGVLLGFVNNITYEPIQIANENATNEAYKQVFADGEFKSDEDLKSKLEEFQKKITDGKLDDDISSYKDVTLIEARTATSPKNKGYVVKASGKGYGGAVVVVLGISDKGEVLGIQILDASNETPGLGQNSTKEDWNSQYIGMNSEKTLQVVKDKSGNKDNGTINSISGATITSSAVTRVVEMALKFTTEQK